MCCLTIRSVTFFTNRVSSRRELEEEIGFAEDIYSVVNELAVRHDLNVFTWRISFPGLEPRLSQYIPDSFLKKRLVSVGYLNRIELEEILSLVESGFYTPILSGFERSMNRYLFYSRVIHTISRIDPIYATRVSIGFHNTSFQTPYFPDSSSRGVREIGLSFIYPRCLTTSSLDELRNSFGKTFSTISSFANRVEEETGIRVLVDYSLSPWMSNSVAEILEKIGFKLLEPGSLYGINFLNESIAEYMDRDRAVGFNEVMLPYAEDDLLKHYGDEGLLHATDFLLFASVCVAGVDMVVVPEDELRLAKLIADAEALTIVKSRALSLRAIPVSSTPGDEITLGKFGKVSVIPY